MALPKFEYMTPKTLDEACSLLALHKGLARLISGGTDIMPQMKDRAVVPQYLIGLKSVSKLNYVKYDKKSGLKIGCLATLAEVAESPAVARHFPLLKEAISLMASVQVRNCGTVAGNLCNAAPSADSAPSLIVMGAKVKLVSAGKKERTIPVEEFFEGPGETALEVGELLAEIQVPNLPSKSGGAYLKLSQRRAMDLAVVGAGCLVTLDGNKCKDIKIALGAVAPTPIRVKAAEELFKGKALVDDLLEKAATAAMKACKPITDIRASSEYRKKMVGVLTKRAIGQAWEKARKAK